MGYNLITNIEVCFVAVRDFVPVNVVYYSHIPSAIVALVVGIFVLLKNRSSLASRLLFCITIFFSIWSFSDMVLWISYDSRMYMFFWVLTIVFEFLCFVFSYYFVYVFLTGRDMPFKLKLFFGALSLPVIFLMPSKYFISYFDLYNCIPIEGPFWNKYLFPVDIFIFLLVIIIAVTRYRKAEKNFKKQIFFLTLGIGLFLLLFFSMEFLSNYLIDNNITDIISAYKYQLYGIFGMPIFMGFLAYLIVKYKAFNIKMIGAQALIFALIVLVGSQFFFAQNNTSKILTGITLVFTGAFGIFLIRSVHEEVKRKEELQYMSDKLAQANDQLRTLDNAKSEFISIASHQLRTPLTSIKGFISLLLEGAYGKFAENQSDVLNKVYKSNERLITLVEDLLNISRIESGRMEFHFEKCQLTVLCQELMDTFSMRAKTSGLYLDYKVPQNPIPEVMVDSAKVREVISNLIDNAIKYTPKGGVTIRVEQADPRLSKIENVGKMGSVRVVISDTGIGVPATEIPYLFSKFSRGKDTGRLNTGGTGLGLYVGKSMIEANGGKVWAESEGAGKGSRFIIEVPVEQTKENLDKWK